MGKNNGPMSPDDPIVKALDKFARNAGRTARKYWDNFQMPSWKQTKNRDKPIQMEEKQAKRSNTGSGPQTYRQSRTGNIIRGMQNGRTTSWRRPTGFRKRRLGRGLRRRLRFKHIKRRRFRRRARGFRSRVLNVNNPVHEFRREHGDYWTASHTGLTRWHSHDFWHIGSLPELRAIYAALDTYESIGISQTKGGTNPIIDIAGGGGALPTMDTNVRSQLFNVSDMRILVKSCQVDYHLRNAATSAMDVGVYWCKVRKPIPWEKLVDTTANTWTIFSPSWSIMSLLRKGWNTKYNALYAPYDPLGAEEKAPYQDPNPNSGIASHLVNPYSSYVTSGQDPSQTNATIGVLNYPAAGGAAYSPTNDQNTVTAFAALTGANTIKPSLEGGYLWTWCDNTPTVKLNDSSMFRHYCKVYAYKKFHIETGDTCTFSQKFKKPKMFNPVLDSPDLSEVYQLSQADSANSPIVQDMNSYTYMYGTKGGKFIIMATTGQIARQAPLSGHANAVAGIGPVSTGFQFYCRKTYKVRKMKIWNKRLTWIGGRHINIQDPATFIVEGNTTGTPSTTVLGDT